MKEALQVGSPGQGCGHNLLGTAALGAALAVKDLMAAGKLKGTIRFYGTPAEEAGGRQGLRGPRGGAQRPHRPRHPDEKPAALGSQAIVEFIVEFTGKTAHAAANPWDGRSAVAGMEFFTTGLNRMREFVKPTVRMHYSILNGGDVPKRGAGLRQALVLASRFEGRRSRSALPAGHAGHKGAPAMMAAQSKRTVQQCERRSGGRRVVSRTCVSGCRPIRWPEEQEFAESDVGRRRGPRRRG